ncbi:MAG: hypothetical protein UMV23_07190, partial [Halanaerobium sp.]|nr:hypothetical protein [Halanaerobium sp.]
STALCTPKQKPPCSAETIFRNIPPSKPSPANLFLYYAHKKISLSTAKKRIGICKILFEP